MTVDNTRQSRLVAGCMTGTSMDALDAALVQIEGAGLAMKATFLRGVSAPLGAVGDRLRRLAAGQPVRAGWLTALARDFGILHRDALTSLLEGRTPDLIAIHGQTVFHAPPLSWQLINPWPVAIAFGAPIVFDLRGADLAAGGEGAPITPLADFILFRDELHERIVVNFGGFINITRIPAGSAEPGDDPGRLQHWADAVRGRDVSICNQLLDRIARQSLRRPYDEGGNLALSGSVNELSLKNLLTILRAQSESKRSLGAGRRALKWVEVSFGTMPKADIARTACSAIAHHLSMIVGNVTESQMIAAGGGALNAALCQEVERACGTKLQLTNELGVPISYREAAAMGILAACAADGIPLTMKSVTHRAALVKSGWFCRIG